MVTMVVGNKTDKKINIRVGNQSDRKTIYRMRHSVYATELSQHSENKQSSLTDALDEFNVYIVAEMDDRIVGFISITPPDKNSYSIDKYLSRDTLPFNVDDGTFEIRILTVDKNSRGSRIAALLMYASLRWIESSGGTRVVVIGRVELEDLYLKIGLKNTGIMVTSGALTFELMTVTINDARDNLRKYERVLKSIFNRVDWELDVPITKSAPSFHGGAFFNAIGTDFTSLQKSKEIINADVLDAWFPPSPKVMDSLQEHLSWLVRTSPPTESDGLIRTIASVRKIDVESVLPGAGSSDLIYRALPNWLDQNSKVLILDPTYGEYAHVLENVVNCKVDRFLLDAEYGYALDPKFLEPYFKNEYDLIVLVNPNNPAGTYVERDVLENILRKVPIKTRVWIDETYIEYIGSEHSLEQFAVNTENVFVCKSMSKVYALSGLRVGYLCGSLEVIESLRGLTPPWNVGLQSQVAGVKALQDPEYYEHRYNQTHKLRFKLSTDLMEMANLDVVNGFANFLLCKIPDTGPTTVELIEKSRKRGLYIRNVATTSPRLGERMFRVAVKDEHTNDKIVSILADGING